MAKADAKGSWTGLRVRDLMQREVATLQRNDKLTIADDVMRLGRIRHLPVVDEDSDEPVVGLVSQRDLFRGALTRAFGYGAVAQRKVMSSLVVKEVMSTPVTTTTPDASLRDAARVMLEKKIGCLPVVEGGKLVGILTESDFVALYARS
jgi:CBS domain-containing protein